MSEQLKGCHHKKEGTNDEGFESSLVVSTSELTDNKNYPENLPHPNDSIRLYTCCKVCYRTINITS